MTNRGNIFCLYLFFNFTFPLFGVEIGLSLKAKQADQPGTKQVRESTLKMSVFRVQVWVLGIITEFFGFG